MMENSGEPMSWGDGSTVILFFQTLSIGTCRPGVGGGYFAVATREPGRVQGKVAVLSFEPGMDITLGVWLKNNKTKGIALAWKNPGKEPQGGKGADHAGEPKLVFEQSEAAPGNTHSVEVNKVVTRPRSITGDGLFDLSFGPPIN